ncbi:MBL fold metallo-hydrolase [Rugosimonospora acidiphila]
MGEIEYQAGLHRLTGNTYAYLQPPGTWGFSNCGLVVGEGEALLVDTQFTLPLTRRLLAAVEEAVPGVPVTTVVTTHANGDHAWGTQLLPDAVTMGSEATAHGMADEIPPQALSALARSPEGASPLGDYARRFFGHFDFDGIVLTPPAKTFTGEAEVTVGGIPAQLIEVGPAHTSGDVIVHVPGEGVLFAGDILFIDDHPVMWTGPVRNWIAACERIAATGAEFVVPGHGPVTDVAGVLVFRDYLAYLDEHARESFRRGLRYWEAAMALALPEPFASWGHRERVVMSFAAIYRELGDRDAADPMAVLHRTAEAYQRLP